MKSAPKLLAMALALTLAIPTAFFTTLPAVEATPTLPYTLDFDSYTLGTVLKPSPLPGVAPAVYNDGTIKVSYSATKNTTTDLTDAVEVATDPVYGNQALKIVKNNLNQTMGLNLDLPKVSTGIVEIGFDYRSELHLRYSPNFGVAIASSGGKITKGVTWAQKVRMGNTTIDQAALPNLSTNNTYTSFKQVINFDAGVFDVYVKKESDPDFVKVGGPYTIDAAVENLGLDNLSFAYMANGLGGGALTYDDDANPDTPAVDTLNVTTPGVYYLDNISVTRVENSIVSATPANGATNVDNASSIDISFEQAVSAAKITPDRLTILRGATVVTPDAYTITNKAANIISLKFKNGMKYNTNYMVTLDSSFTGEPYNFQFTTAPISAFTTFPVIDFENYEENVNDDTFLNPPQNTTTSSNDGLLEIYHNNTAAAPNNHIDVVTDPVSGSKALRIRYDNANKQTNLKIDLPNVLAGTAEVSFDFRAATHKRYINNFGKILNSSSSAMNYGITWGNNVRYQAASVETLNISTYSDYASYKTIYNLADKTHTVWLKKTTDSNYVQKGATYADLNTTTSSNVDKLHFTFAGRGGTGGAVSDSDTSVGVYYIDNIRVSKSNALALSTSTIANGATDVDINTDSATLYFNYPLLANTVNKTNITVTKNGTALDTADYDLEYSETDIGNGIKVLFNNKFVNDDSYQISVGTSVLEATQTVTALAAPVVLSFDIEPIPVILTVSGVTNKADDAAVDNIAAAADKTVKVALGITNNTGGTVTGTIIAAVYDTDGNMLDMAASPSASITAGSDPTHYLELDVPANAAYIKTFIWDAFGTALPLCDYALWQ